MNPTHPRPTLSPRAGAAVASLLACTAVLLASRVAHADPYEDHYDESNTSDFALGFDLEGAIPIGIPTVDGNQIKGGGGFKVRAGEQVRFPFLRLTPELGYGYDHLFANNDVGASSAWDLHRVFAGARLGFGYLIVPVIYGHLGYGWRDTGAGDVTSAGGLSYDVGAALDLHLIPHFAIGVHGEYDGIQSQPDTPQWLVLGAHANLVF